LQDATHNFLLAARFYTFMTVSYIVAAACEYMKLSNEDLSVDFTEVPIEAKREMLEQVSQFILKLEWHDIQRVTSQSL
jgi:23S rRNA maturation-related 3'-5' exoribonuclease YhaM